MFKPANAALNAHLVELAREVKIFSPKHKPAMISRDVEILYEKKQLVLEQQVQSIAIVSNFVAGSIQSQVSKESRPQQKHSVAFFSTAGQVQPRLLHRSFSAGQSVHNCIFNIKVLLQFN